MDEEVDSLDLSSRRDGNIISDKDKLYGAVGQQNCDCDIGGRNSDEIMYHMRGLSTEVVKPMDASVISTDLVPASSVPLSTQLTRDHTSCATEELSTGTLLMPVTVDKPAIVSSCDSSVSSVNSKTEPSLSFYAQQTFANILQRSGEFTNLTKGASATKNGRLSGTNVETKMIDDSLPCPSNGNQMLSSQLTHEIGSNIGRTEVAEKSRFPAVNSFHWPSSYGDACLDSGKSLQQNGQPQPCTISLDLPLEVIGACWFMKKDTETCLQALTDTEEKVVIRLNKRDNRVNLTFEAISGSAAFSMGKELCHCHVETLLEPPRRPSVVTGSSTVSSVPKCSQNDANSGKMNVAGAGEAGPGISSRLRIRVTGGIKYEGEDEEEEDERADAPKCDDDMDATEELDDVDEDEDEDEFDCDETDGADEEEEEEEDDEEEDEDVQEVPGPKPSCKKNLSVKSQKQQCSRALEHDADEWTPKHPKRPSKQSHVPIRLKVKIKDESASSLEKVEQEADGQPEDQDSTSEVSDASDHQVTRKWRKGLASSGSNNTAPEKHHHKKAAKNTEVKCRRRRIRTKDGPKWEKKGVCPHCGIFYGNLGQHVGLYCPKNPDRQRAYHCCYCKFRSLDRASLIEHKATHVLARDFKCEICDSAFYTRQRLVRHMRYVHLLGTNPVRIYTCDRCGKRFRYHSHYDRHLTIHSEEKTAQCDKCGKFFKNSHNVRNHQSRMHPGKPEPFPFYCEKCGQGAHSLTAHRCIKPGEMHGSRRRRAPRSSTLTSTHSGATSNPADNVPVALPSPSAVDRLSVTSQNSEQQTEASPSLHDPRIASPQVVDCRSSTNSQAAECRSSSVQPDCSVSAASQITDNRSVPSLHPAVDRHTTGGSQVPDRYSVPSGSQPYDRHNMPFDHHSSTQLVDHHLVPGIGRSPYHRHHPQASLTPNEPPYDRRVAPPFEHLPAMAHQPPQQPPYSNIFAVDPLLQLRAANMMYRMDY